MLAPLTEREAKVVGFMGRELRRLRVPSYDEMARAAGLSSRGCTIARVLASLEDKGYVSRARGKRRAIRLNYSMDGQPFNAETVRIPLVGCIAAGEPIPVPGADYDPFVGEMLELTREMVGEGENVYALRVQGDSMIDALVNDGDVVIMRHQPSVEDGEMAAVWLGNGEGTTLKYLHRERDRVRLQPANPLMKPMYYSHRDVVVQGKVLLIIRNVN